MQNNKILRQHINSFAEGIGWKSLSFAVLYNISYSLRFLWHKIKCEFSLYPFYSYELWHHNSQYYILDLSEFSTSPTGSANHLSPLRFQTFNEKYFEIGMKLNDFSIQLVKYCSWLNAAEIEINVMDIECTDRRISDIEILTHEVGAWEKKRNELEKRIEWKFSRKNADEKMSKYYAQ